MNRKRERIVIIYDILKAIQDKGGRSRPTHIMYKSNLSSQMLKEYLGELVKKDFIAELPGTTKRYQITLRGNRYVQDFNTIKKFMESYDLED